MNKVKILSICAVVLLLPAIGNFLSSIGAIWAFINILQTLSVSSEAGDPKLLAGALSMHITLQLFNILVLLPGLILSTIATLKFKAQYVWFRKSMALYSWLLVVSLPVLTIVGIYLIWLRRKINV